MQQLVAIDTISIGQPGKPALEGISFAINRGEHWALTGPSGSGKTLLSLAITGEVHFRGTLSIAPGLSIQRVMQQHQFRNRSNIHEFYYQQRYQSLDADDAYTARELMKKEWDKDPSLVEEMSQRLHVAGLLDRPLIQLSNGENKRVQLLRALLKKPDLLILDNPFIGLDTEGRALLHKLLNEVSRVNITLMVICPPEEIPACTTHVAELNGGKLTFAGKRSSYSNSAYNNVHSIQHTWAFPGKAASHTFQHAVEMRNVHIHYAGKEILQSINWTVTRGDSWLLSGPNGAGKSTLLSLINADNPQAYANEIYLFDQRRGRGESIWDIKKQIGFVSPELHLFFDQGITAREVVGSGLFDTIGLFRKLSPDQEALVGQWLSLMELREDMERPLKQLSLGRQRMVLLARALVKNPPLLILDEPCQGLDGQQAYYFNSLVSAMCHHFGTTLIYVSHYAESVPVCIDQHIRLEGGRRVL